MECGASGMEMPTGRKSVEPTPPPGFGGAPPPLVLSPKPGLLTRSISYLKSLFKKTAPPQSCKSTPSLKTLDLRAGFCTPSSPEPLDRSRSMPIEVLSRQETTLHRILSSRFYNDINRGVVWELRKLRPIISLEGVNTDLLIDEIEYSINMGHVELNSILRDWILALQVEAMQYRKVNSRRNSGSLSPSPVILVMSRDLPMFLMNDRLIVVIFDDHIADVHLDESLMRLENYSEEVGDRVAEGFFPLSSDTTSPITTRRQSCASSWSSDYRETIVSGIDYIDHPESLHSTGSVDSVSPLRKVVMNSHSHPFDPVRWPGYSEEPVRWPGYSEEPELEIYFPVAGVRLFANRV